MCQASNKMWADYYRLRTTDSFLKALNADMGIPISDLVRVIKGGDPRMQGTWVHPQVAINLGQWCSPEFAVKVSQWVYDWMNDKAGVWRPGSVSVTAVLWMACG